MDEEKYGCFSCGHDEGPFIDTGEQLECPNCGRPTVVPFSQALGVLQFLEQSGYLIAADVEVGGNLEQYLSFTLVLPENSIGYEDLLEDWDELDETQH